MDVLDEQILRIGHRMRVGTASDLAREVDAPAADIESALERLTAAGRLQRSGATLVWTHPAADLSERSRGMLGGIREAADDLARAMDELPSRLRDWEAGERRAHESVGARLYEGPEAIQELWKELFASGSPRSIRVAASGVEVIRTFGIPDFAAAEEHIAEHGIDIRLVIGASPAEDVVAEAAPLVVSSVAARVSGPLRSWFLVLDDTVALPLEWGSPRFDGVLVVTNPSFAALASELFDRIWSASTAMDSASRTWEPLLDLLATGTTIETAARMLGIAERTARRRVADAMTHFNATSLFSLGIAWQRRAARA